jgi:hypothetical protein
MRGIDQIHRTVGIRKSPSEIPGFHIRRNGTKIQILPAREIAITAANIKFHRHDERGGGCRLKVRGYSLECGELSPLSLPRPGSASGGVRKAETGKAESRNLERLKTAYARGGITNFPVIAARQATQNKAAPGRRTP